MHARSIKNRSYLALITLPLFAAPAFATTCEDLTKATFPHTTILSAESIPGGTFTPAAGKAISNLPAFCRVSAAIHPVPDSDIRVEMWLPPTASAWNGRMEGTGNGGFAGKIEYNSLAAGIRLGYAVANTNMGTATPAGQDAAIFINHPERWTDWGSRATHEMTLLARQIVQAFYAAAPKRSYFVGCSTGGQQALMEAQRFPDDYDGIVGGAPAHNRTGVHTSILWNFAATRQVPDSYLPAEKISLLATAVLNACTRQKATHDGLITDPRRCTFDPASLQCKAGDPDTNACLSSAQVASAKALYAGPINPRTHQQIYPGLPLGSEPGWGGLGAAPSSTAKLPYAPIFQWVFGSDWDWRTFDYDHDFSTYTQRLAPTLNATDPNLDPFRQRGHKLLLYHGWADWLVAPQETITYFEAVQAREATRPLGTPLESSVRLFMVPGMAHCGGGQNPASFDPLAVVVQWVEHDTAPARLIATTPPPSPDAPPRQTVLCPYPQQPQSATESGDPAAATCKSPTAPVPPK